MLIKKNLKTKRLCMLTKISCPIVLKLKKQPFPFYPTCKKQNGTNRALLPLPSSLSPKIEQKLLEYLPHWLSAKRQDQKEKKILRFLYPVNYFNFQGKSKFLESFCIFTLINSKKKYNFTFAPFASANTKEKESQLKIVLKSYSSQLKDIEISIAVISKLTHRLNNCCTKQLKTFSANPLCLPSLGFYSSFFNQPVRIKKFNSSNDLYPGVSSTFSLLGNFKMRMFLFQQKALKKPQMPLSFNLLIEQPLAELLSKTCEERTKGQKKDQPSFLLSTLQKKNYCNRYFLKSSVSLDNNGPINKQVQKTLNSTKLFTVIRSPFVFKKTREQFNLKKLCYSATIGLNSPIQKQLFIQCLSLLRLPAELEIHC